MSVTPEYLEELYQSQNAQCALTGVHLSMAVKRKDTSTASPDRIDPSKGYVEGNVRWVHKTINSMRNSMCDQEFRRWCRLVCEAPASWMPKCDDIIVKPVVEVEREK